MKTIVFLLILSTNAFSQEKDMYGHDQFSEIYKIYSDKHKKVIVQFASVPFWGQKWTRYKILYKQKRNWFAVEHFTSPAQLQKDSVVVNKCSDCALVYQQLRSQEKKLKSEKEITTPCTKVTPVVYMGDSANKFQDLHWISDLDSQVIEYRDGKKTKRIIQLSPTEALNICPEVKERKVFRDLLNAIKSVM
jgi:hypothetical protein